jgi:hypothetical protein
MPCITRSGGVLLLLASTDRHLVSRVLNPYSTLGQGIKSTQLANISFAKIGQLINLWLEVGDGGGIRWK